jgi:hypothetical protein
MYESVVKKYSARNVVTFTLLNVKVYTLMFA